MYRLVYGEKATYHNNLCPYFWKGIVCGWPLAILLGVLNIPIFLLGIIIRDKTLRSEYKYNGLFSWISTVAFLVNIVLIFIFCMMGMWWLHPFGKNSGSIVAVGFVGWGITTIITISLLTNYIIEPRKKKKFIIGAAADAWWKKYCSKIEWEEK